MLWIAYTAKEILDVRKTLAIVAEIDGHAPYRVGEQDLHTAQQHHNTQRILLAEGNDQDQTEQRDSHRSRQDHPDAIVRKDETMLICMQPVPSLNRGVHATRRGIGFQKKESQQGSPCVRGPVFPGDDARFSQHIQILKEVCPGFRGPLFPRRPFIIADSTTIRVATCPEIIRPEIIALETTVLETTVLRSGSAMGHSLAPRYKSDYRVLYLQRDPEIDQETISRVAHGSVGLPSAASEVARKRSVARVSKVYLTGMRESG